MAKVLKSDGAAPYFATLTVDDVPANMPAGTVDVVLRFNGTAWAATNFLKVAADGAVNMTISSSAANPSLTITNNANLANVLKVVKQTSTNLLIDNSGNITSNALSGSGDRYAFLDSSGRIKSGASATYPPEKFAFVSGNFTTTQSPYYRDIMTALLSEKIYIFIYTGGGTLTDGIANKYIFANSPSASIDITFGAFTYDNCTFDSITISSIAGATFNNCTFINCLNTGFGFGFNATFTGTNTFNSPRMSLGGFINNGTLKGAVKNCNQYFINNGNLSLTLESINLTTISCYLGDNSKTEINGAKIFVSQVAAFQCGVNALLVLNYVKIKGTTDAWAVDGNTGVILNANNCIFDAKSATGFSVQYIDKGLWNGVVASGSITANFSSTNALNANVADLFDTIKSF